jgi:hypothetical protein
LKFVVTACAASWFATMPAGIETMIAIEKARAMITNSALIFLLDRFLIARVKAPKSLTYSNLTQASVNY